LKKYSKKRKKVKKKTFNAYWTVMRIQVATTMKRSN